jgi:proline dehydrogenase
MLDAAARGMFSALAGSRTLKRLASRYGMRQPAGFARRFVAGETLEEAVAAARVIEEHGLLVTLDLLGEQVTTVDAAAAATRAYLAVVAELERTGVARNLSVKLTQLGLDVDRATSIDNLRRVLDGAAKAGFFVRIDMEDSHHTDETLDAFETVWRIGCRNTGVALQSALRRSAADLERVNRLGASVRLVKGAYREPRAVAFQKKSEVDAAFVDLMRVLLRQGTSPAIATHDPVLIDETRRFAQAQGIGADRFEFQMLYGVRRDLQTMLAAQGHRLRVYVPFGRDWFPYFMRRLGERPANVGFVLRSMIREK